MKGAESESLCGSPQRTGTAGICRLPTASERSGDSRRLSRQAVLNGEGGLCSSDDCAARRRPASLDICVARSNRPRPSLAKDVRRGLDGSKPKGSRAALPCEVKVGRVGVAVLVEGDLVEPGGVNRTTDVGAPRLCAPGQRSTMGELRTNRLPAPRRGHDQDRDMADADDGTFLDVHGPRRSQRFLPGLRSGGSVLSRTPCTASDAGRLTRRLVCPLAVVMGGERPRAGDIRRFSSDWAAPLGA